MEKLQVINQQNQRKHRTMKKYLLDCVHVLYLEREEMREVYTEETLNKLNKLIQDYYTLISKL